MSELSMSQEKVLNRWCVVVGAIVIQLCLGVVYAWSVFTPRLTDMAGSYLFSAGKAASVFSAALVTFALVMLFAGRMQAKIGPAKTARIGGAVLGLGYVLGGLLGKTFAMQFICIGIIGGAGIGLAYVVPIAVGVKWFPDKKGLITGLAVAGFGFGATLWVKFAGSWFGGLLNTLNLFDLGGVQSVFLLYGILFFVLIILGSLVMVNPPEGWKPAGWDPHTSNATAKNKTSQVDMMPMQMMSTPQYWGLLLMFAGSATAGLMVIYCIRLFGIDSLVANSVVDSREAAGVIAGTAMAWYAILNGLGRIIWGGMSDKMGRKGALLLMCLFQGVMMLVFYRIGQTELGLIIGAAIIGFNFGGNFALFPAATADFFGNKHVGVNYPWVFLAYGVAGLVGPQLAGYFKDNAVGTEVNMWFMPFLIAGVACFISAAIALILRVPKDAKTVEE